MTSDVLRVLAAALLSGACLIGCKNSVNDGVGASGGNGGSGASSSTGGEDGTGGSGGHNGGSGGHNGGSGGDDDSDEDGSGGCGDGSGGGCGLPDWPCEVRDVEGTIPGVKITIESSRCAYHQGEPAEFVYTITTDSTVPPIDIAASTGCGRCVEPTSDPLSLVSYKISGVSWGDPQPQLYCVCDVGCCAPDEAVTVQVDATTVTQTIRWSGRQWTGPSDTNNPDGAFFAKGSYDVEVTFDGQAQGSVTAKLPIEIYP